MAPLLRRRASPRALDAQHGSEWVSGSMAANRRTRTDREVPIIPKVEVSVEQAAKRLRRLSPDKLRRVRRYEEASLKRANVLAAIDALLRGELRE